MPSNFKKDWCHYACHIMHFFSCLGIVLLDGSNIVSTIIGTVRTSLLRQDDLKMGTLVGTDKMGNKYYENNEYFLGRNRWVIYAPSVGTDYDSSMIAPEWFGWMHHKTDTPPTQKEALPFEFIQEEQTVNPSGTPNSYMPYSTTKPKVEAWLPPKRNA